MNVENSQQNEFRVQSIEDANRPGSEDESERNNRDGPSQFSKESSPQQRWDVAQEVKRKRKEHFTRKDEISKKLKN